MKKSIFVLAIMIAMVSFVQKVNAQTASTTFNFSATVEKYIAVAEGTVDVGLVGSWNHTKVNPGIAGSQNLVGFPQWKTRLEDNVYANCPFTVTYSGMPILSRTELNGNGVDRLQTSIVIRNYINGYYGSPQAGYERQDMSFVSGPEGSATGTFTNPSLSFQTPHNGEVITEIFMSAALPHLSPDFGNANTWNQSADAGLYTCQVIATYTAM